MTIPLFGVVSAAGPWPDPAGAGARRGPGGRAARLAPPGTDATFRERLLRGGFRVCAFFGKGFDSRARMSEILKRGAIASFPRRCEGDLAERAWTAGLLPDEGAG